MDLTNTNVTALLTGAGCAQNLSAGLGRFVVTTMEIPWKVTKDIIGGKPAAVIMIDSMEESWLEDLLIRLPVCDTVVGVGGGQAIDAAKYFAWRRGLRLVSIPTILSVDAFVTPAAGIRRSHEVVYVGSSSPDPLVIDFELLRTAPPELNIAGVGDLLSIHTATFDWEYAHSRGKSEYPFSPEDVQRGRNILQSLYPRLADIRRNNDAGLWAIVEGYLAMNKICLPAGHYCIEEGSEHFLFYELEERLARPFVHGYIIGLGIYLMSQLQNNGFELIRGVMDEVGLNYHPVHLDIQKTDLVAALMNVKDFVAKKPQLWYSIIDDRNISSAWANRAVEGLKF